MNLFDWLIYLFYSRLYCETPSCLNIVLKMLITAKMGVMEEYKQQALATTQTHKYQTHTLAVPYLWGRRKRKARNKHRVTHLSILTNGSKPNQSHKASKTNHCASLKPYSAWINTSFPTHSAAWFAPATKEAQFRGFPLPEIEKSRCPMQKMNENWLA